MESLKVSSKIKTVSDKVTKKTKKQKNWTIMMSCSTLQEKTQTKRKAIPEREDCLRRNEELILDCCLKVDPGERVP